MLLEIELLDAEKCNLESKDSEFLEDLHEPMTLISNDSYWYLEEGTGHKMLPKPNQTFRTHIFSF